NIVYQNGKEMSKVLIKSADTPKTQTQTLQLPEGTYMGLLKDGKPMGLGQLTYPNGDIYYGTFKDNQSRGTLVSGSDKFKVTYLNGKLIKKIPFKNSSCGRLPQQPILTKP